MKKKYNMTYADPKKNPNMSMAPVKKKFVPYYGGYGGKMSDGTGWGGEMPMKKGMPAINPSINTTSKKNKAGEIINPTKSDVVKFNAKYTTVKLPANVKRK